MAAKLIDYTLNMTDNTTHFPKKVRFSIVNRIQERVLSVYENLLQANEIFPIRNEADRDRRLQLQRDALSDCKMLLFYIELSKGRGFIDAGTFEYWTKITLDVKFMAAAWHKAELNPAGESDPDNGDATVPPEPPVAEAKT